MRSAKIIRSWALCGAMCRVLAISGFDIPRARHSITCNVLGVIRRLRVALLIFVNVFEAEPQLLGVIVFQAIESRFIEHPSQVAALEVFVDLPPGFLIV